MAKTKRSAPNGGPKPKPTAKTWIKRIALAALIAFLVLSIVGIAAVAYLYNTVHLPDPNKDFQTNTTHLYYRDGETQMADLQVQNRESIAYAEMPKNIKDAVIAIENQSFWTDKGISVWGMARGAVSILTGGNVQGGSTITQQYIKILYLTSDQSMSRKAKELILAYKMGQELSKEQILEGYLNTIYFGRGAYGIQAASKAFFGVNAKDLNLSQAVTLAALLNDPGGFDPPRGNVKLLLERYQVTLNNMVEMGTITAAQRAEVYTKLPDFPQQQKDSRYGGPKGFLVKMVENELRAKGFTEAQVKGGGLRVITTIDPALQDAAVTAAQKNLAAAGKNARSGADPAALRAGLASVQVGTGELLALYGGADYVADSANWATTPRQTASVFKINAVVAALQNGFSLNTMLNGNTYTPRGDKEPVYNSGNANYGQITLLKATANSVNTAFVDLVEKMPDGPNQVVKAANALGIPTDASWQVNLDNRIALGSAEVSPLAEATGLATLANEGVYVPTHIVKEVRDAKGAVVYTADTKGEQRISKDVAADATYALTKVVSEGTASRLSSLGYPSAGKTGTKADGKLTRAAWFAGTTKQVATAVDFMAGTSGYEDLNPYRASGSSSFFGSSYPAATWLDYMKVAMKGLDKLDFPKPSYVNGGKTDDTDATPSSPEAPVATNGPTPSVAPVTVAPSQKPASTPTSAPTQVASVAPTPNKPKQDPTAAATPTP